MWRFSQFRTALVEIVSLQKAVRLVLDDRSPCVFAALNDDFVVGVFDRGFQLTDQKLPKFGFRR